MGACRIVSILPSHLLLVLILLIVAIVMRLPQRLARGLWATGGRQTPSNLSKPSPGTISALVRATSTPMRDAVS